MIFVVLSLQLACRSMKRDKMNRGFLHSRKCAHLTNKNGVAFVPCVKPPAISSLKFAEDVSTKYTPLNRPYELATVFGSFPVLPETAEKADSFYHRDVSVFERLRFRCSPSSPRGNSI